MKQHSEQVAVIYPPAAGELSVHVSRWEQEPGDTEERQALVMYRITNSYHYLAPTAARLFAEALLEAADKAESLGG